jgi:hypothetical protein
LIFNGFEIGKLHIIHAYIFFCDTNIATFSDKKHQLLPLEKYTIITDRRKLRSSDSDHDASVPSLSSSLSTATITNTTTVSAEILNRRFKDLPPEELQFDDDNR